MSTRITPDEPFPEDLSALPTPEVEVLNSKLHRELDYEYVHEDGPSPETESRLEEVTEELDFRDLTSVDLTEQEEEAVAADTSGFGLPAQDAQGARSTQHHAG